MATKSSSARNSKKTSKQSRTNKKVIASRRSRLTSRPLLILTAFLFGSAGIYLLVQSGALQPDEVLLADQPERGLIYNGKKVKTKGPCAGSFDVTTEEDVQQNKKEGKDIRRCAHIDPTPPGVNIRERAKTVEKELAAMVAHDKKYPPASADDKSGYVQPSMPVAETITGSSMAGLPGYGWSCRGTGMDGPRVQLIYLYPSNATNRIGTLRPGFSTIVSRMNAIFFDSGKESGRAHMARFATIGGAAGCPLSMPAVAIRADMMHDFTYIKNHLKNLGYKGVPVAYDTNKDGVTDYTRYENRKYLIWVDRDTAYTPCGLGEVNIDDSPGQTNRNNTAVTYAASWKGCWNYAEPHELMHNLGGVQSRYVTSTGTVLNTGAPHATKGWHCYDERDIMCYDDDGAGGVYMRNICTRTIDLWRFDCRHDDYYRGVTPTTGYLSNHWNTAKSKYLYPY